jgi:tRNA A-37 threonylcarbamoyl transferase component Bud32
MSTPELTLRDPGLLTLPWELPLAEWNPAEVPLRDFAVGPSRHLVKFVETEGRTWALKEMPHRVAQREYAVLRELEERGLPAVRPAGVVLQEADTAILVTRYLAGSWQYRRLFMRLPPNRPAHRARLFDAMAGLLVDLHRNGIFWGDCSLANTLFSRDGQLLQAWLVDAETGEVHRTLSHGQRNFDLDILVENVAGGMIDLAERLELPPEIHPQLIAEAAAIPERYEALWEVLHAGPTFSFGDRYRVEGKIRELNELGFAVEEVTLAPSGDAPGRLRLQVGVGDRRYHARRLQELTGLDVGEGQARVLLGDLEAHRAWLSRRNGRDPSDAEAAASWREVCFGPGTERAFAALGRVGSPVQAYCDLLEVRWILSERAGRDVGDARALAALAGRAPTDSAARAAVVEPSTGWFELP